MNAAADALRLTLVHALWQHAAIAALLSVALFGLRRYSPASRYVAACAGLASTVVVSMTTFMVLLDPAPAVTVQSRTHPALPAIALVTPTADTRVWISSDRLRTWPAPVVPDWILPAWLAGFAICSLRWSAAAARAASLRRTSTPADDTIRAGVRRLALAMGVARDIDVRLTTHIAGPGTLGWLRPVILVPPAVAMGLPARQLEAILAHEIAHIRRHDYAVNVLQALVEALFFYHPAVWWVSARIRFERELCCDDAAVCLCGDALGYARALTAIAKGPSALRPAIVAAAEGQLVQRVHRLIGRGTSPSGSAWPAALVCALIAASLVGTAYVQGQSRQTGGGSPESSGTLTLTVFDPLGAPADGIPIVFEQGAFQDGLLFGDGRTDRNGRYVVRLPVGTYVFTAGIDFFPPTTVTIEPGQALEREVRMRVEEVTGSFTVCVTCPDDDAADVLPESLAAELQRDRDEASMQLVVAAEPAGGWEGFRPRAPQSLRERSAIEGTVVVEGRIAVDGHVNDARVADGAGGELAAAALAAVTGQRWEPARVRGEPIEVPLRLTIQYIWAKAAR